MYTEFMVAKIVVILFVFLCLMIGFILVLFPWFSFGALGDWGDNYLLRLVVEKTGYEAIHTVVASPWFRGGVSGLGVFNILLAFWEVAYFEDNVAALEKK